MSFWKKLAVEAIEALQAQKLQKVHVNMAVKLLDLALPDVLDDSSLSAFILRTSRFGENVKFSASIQKALQQLPWGITTRNRIFNASRRILLHIGADEKFVASLSGTSVKTSKVGSSVLPALYRDLPDDDPVRMLLEEWVMRLRACTRMKSTLSLRNIMCFILRKLLPALGATLAKWNDVMPETLRQRVLSPGTIESICGNASNQRRMMCWTNQFFMHILKTAKPDFPDHVVGKIRNFDFNSELERRQQDDGRDHHRIKKEDLELMDATFQPHVLDHLIFRLMITTGLRIGGVVRIKTKDVVLVGSDGTVEVGTQGITLEKGGKNVCFKMRKKVRELVESWVKDHRPAVDSPYLIPSRTIAGGHATTASVRMRFVKLCKEAGLEGQQFHPHALRHSFAHMMLESGTELAVVSKLLNHSSTVTTEKFYLKESISELVERSNIPMYNEGGEQKERKNPLPKFLTNGKDRQELISKRKRKKQRIAGQLSELQAIVVR